MISALSSVQNDRRRLDQQEEQIRQSASQFAQLGQEREFGRALQLIAQGNQKSREALRTALGHLAPHYRAEAEAAMQGPIDPSVQAADAAQAGYAAAGPQGQGMLNQEAATRAMTGMNVGQLGASQVGGGLAADAQITPDQRAAYVQRMASGQTPLGAQVENSTITQGLVPFIARTTAGAQLTAPQAAQNTIAQGQLAVANIGASQGWAQLDQNERRMAAEYGLDKMLKSAQAAKALGAGGGLTGQEKLDAIKTMSTIINDINNPRSDEQGNKGRIRIFNTLADETGQPWLKLPDPGGSAGTPANQGAFHQFMQSLSGLGPRVPTGQIAPLPQVAPNQQPPSIILPPAPDLRPAPAWPGARP